MNLFTRRNQDREKWGDRLPPGQKATEADTGFLRLIEARLPFKDFEFPIDGPMGLRWRRRISQRAQKRALS